MSVAYGFSVDGIAVMVVEYEDVFISLAGWNYEASG